MYTGAYTIRTTQEPVEGVEGNLEQLSRAREGLFKGLGSGNQDPGPDSQEPKLKGRYVDVFERAAPCG